MARALDISAFNAAYEAHAKGVYSTALRILGKPSDAEDVTQDVFLRFWQSPERFDASRSPLGAFLRLMARSRALDVWRHEHANTRAQERLEQRSARDDVHRDERPDEAAEATEQREVVRDALRRLPADQREAVVLAYWGGMTGREVASEAGVPFGTARSRIRLGLDKLRGDDAFAASGEAA